MRSFATPGDRGLFAAVALVVAAQIAFAGRPDAAGQTLAYAAPLLCLLHAAFAYGVRNAAAFFLIAFVVSVSGENIGIASGLLFGRYHFALGPAHPQIGAVPVLAGLMWWSMGWLAWQIAAVLLDDADLRLGERGPRIALPIVATFVLEQWDYAIDRTNATQFHIWVWRDGGGDFGVPLQNYVGWLLVGWALFQLAALYLARRPPQFLAPAAQPRLRIIALAFWTGAGLACLVPWAVGGAGEIADASGRMWRLGDLSDASVAAAVSGMLATAAIAAAKLALRRP